MRGKYWAGRCLRRQRWLGEFQRWRWQCCARPRPPRCWPSVSSLSHCCTQVLPGTSWSSCWHQWRRPEMSTRTSRCWGSWRSPSVWPLWRKRAFMRPQPATESVDLSQHRRPGPSSSGRLGYGAGTAYVLLPAAPRCNRSSSCWLRSSSRRWSW